MENGRSRKSNFLTMDIRNRRWGDAEEQTRLGRAHRIGRDATPQLLPPRRRPRRPPAALPAACCGRRRASASSARLRRCCDLLLRGRRSWGRVAATVASLAPRIVVEVPVVVPAVLHLVRQHSGPVVVVVAVVLPPTCTGQLPIGVVLPPTFPVLPGAVHASIGSRVPPPPPPTLPAIKPSLPTSVVPAPAAVCPPAEARRGPAL